MKTFIETYNKRITILLLVALVLTILTMRIFDAPLKNEVSENGIITFELAKDLDKSVAILNAWDMQAKINASLSMGFDFLFLLVYSSFIALLIFNINNRLWTNKPFHRIGKLLIILIFVAAFFDIIENIALIQLLLGDLKQLWSSIAYYFATAKFILLLICIGYLLINWLLLFLQKKPRE